jgi:CRISPR-associated protein Cas1
MRALYVAQAGATIRREGGLLRVFVRRELALEVPAREIEQLVLIGNVLLTPSSLDLVFENGIDTVFLSHHGKFRGRLSFGASSNVRLRLAQLSRLSDPAACLELARDIVDAKLANQRALLSRFVRRHGASQKCEVARISLAAARERLRLCESLDEVRGCEGAGAAMYFRAFGDLLRTVDFRFDGRNRRPPLDPINALLSFGYTLVSNLVYASIEVVGLDPYIGALHAPVSGRPSLVCDLVEELRVPLVDSLVVAGVNRGAFSPEWFEEVGPGEPVVMAREAVAALITLLERRLQRTAIVAGGRRLPWRKVIEEQVRLLARWVDGNAERYQPYRVDD